PTPTTAAQVAPLVGVEIASFAPAPVTHIDDDMRALEPAPPHWIIDVPADHWTIDVPRDHWSF
ncbi:MAG TPA: hypothetical protein VN764_00780, partial [Polyangiaceae bacterium]|nr:hypothetical protein [Polyangiaceae bacterium]